MAAGRGSALFNCTVFGPLPPPPPPPFLSLPQVLRKLEGSLAAGQFYEAHEMFKTVYYRHRARGQAEQSYELAAVRLLGSMLCWIH